jgi:CRISPR type III-B/RAMP module-associated protein Cmr5
MTREQERATLAFTQVKAVPDKEFDKYATATRKAQALIRNGGLCQALHFLRGKDDSGKLLVDHLAKHLMKVDNGEALLAKVRQHPLPEYLAATREVMACLVWQCRMVESFKDEKKPKEGQS